MTGSGKKLMTLSLAGFALGMLVCAVFYLLGFYPDETVLNRPAFFIQLTGTGLMGAVCVGGTIVYSIESWSIIRSTFVHYILAMGTFFAANYLLGWGYFDRHSFIFVILMMTLLYFIIWLVQYAICKHEIKKLNRDLEAVIQGEKDGEHL